MFDVVPRRYRDHMHHFKYLRDDPPHVTHLITDDFFRDHVCERQEGLQPVHKIKSDPVDPVFQFQELNGQG